MGNIAPRSKFTLRRLGGLDEEYNHRIFNKLKLNSSQIEAAFGQKLRWKADLGGLRRGAGL